MITVNISEELSCEEALNRIMRGINEGIKSFELKVRAIDIEILNQSEDFFEMIQRKKIEMIFNLQESNLEYLLQAIISERDLTRQVKYAGRVNPIYLSARERLNIYYNIENCLPNVYQFETIKKAHFDVIHYFSRKHKVKTLRIHVEALSEELLCWANDNELKLSVVGVDSYKQAEKLETLGIDQITTNDHQMITGKTPEKM